MDICAIMIGFFAYFVGAIPIGYLIARLKGIDDIRAHGSGNIGATNVSRVLGTPYFFLIFLLDAGKAYFFLHILQNYYAFDMLCVFAGILLLGNCYSIFLQGTGGKGVATLLGLIALLEPRSIPVLLGVWGIILLLTRTVGIASIVAVGCLPLYVYMTTDNNSFFIFSPNHTPFYLFSVFASSLVLWRHQSNIAAYLKK